MENSEPPVVEIEYINYEDLIDIENHEECLKTLFNRLDQSNWIIICTALTDVRKIAKFHSGLLPQDQLKKIVSMALKALNNPRSALCKTAIMTVSDLIKAYPEAMVSQLDKILLPLLLKAFQDKKFVCEEAERSLTSIALTLKPEETLNKLIVFAIHKNPRVRAKAASTFFLTASRLNHSEIEAYGLAKLMKVAAAQVIDQFPEAREAGRKLLFHLKASYEQLEKEKRLTDENENNNHKENGNTKVEDFSPQEKASWEMFCKKTCSATEALSVLKITA